LSVADSNAAQFDVISDFRSGSDRIDLAALGALAFLALTSTSTSVPARTIAWIYDSAANETIVYVNPTDQTLNIGDSGLLEIHLQGIVSVAASDFVYAAATASAAVAGEPINLELAATAASDDETIATAAAAEASSDWIVSDSALLADWNWTTRTVGERDSFDFARDGEARTYSTGSTNDDAAIATPTSGPPVEVHHSDVTAPAEQNFALDQKPVLETNIHGANFAALNSDLVTPSQVKQGQTLDHDGGTARSHNDTLPHSATNSDIQSGNEDHGPKRDHKPTTMKDAANSDDAQGNANHGGPNSGIPNVQGNAGDDHHSNSGGTNKHDTTSNGASNDEPATVHAASGSVAAHEQGHGDSFHFKDKMAGPKASDVIEKDSEMDVVVAPISPSDKTAAPDYSSTVSHHPSDHFNPGGDHMGNGHAHAALDLIV
jgi:hypothetical protein